MKLTEEQQEILKAVTATTEGGLPEYALIKVNAVSGA